MDVATGVAAGSPCLASAGCGLPVVNIGGGGRPSHPRSRRVITS